MPLFSIVVPVYNAAPYLADCLDSLLAQTCADWEAICVDDGSTDGSGAILDGYAAKDSRFRVVHQKDAGAWSARNAALDMATGEWVCFLDSDDMLAPKWLEHAVGGISAEVDMVRMECRHGALPPQDFGDEPQGGAGTTVISEGEVPRWGWSTFSRYGYICLCFLRRDVVGSARFPQMDCKEDKVFLLGLLPRIRGIAHVAFAGYFYRKVFGSLSFNGKRHVGQVCSLIGAYADIWDAQGSWARERGIDELVRGCMHRDVASEICSWAVERIPGERAEYPQVRDAYRRFAVAVARPSGVGNGVLCRYKVPFAMWLSFGWVWPLGAVAAVSEAIGDRLRAVGLKGRRS